MFNCIQVHKKIRLKGGGDLKKDWQRPVLEVLDVNQTMLGEEGEFTDAAYDAGTPFEDITFS